MFDFMARYRTAIMWVCVFSMVGFGAWAYLQSTIFAPSQGNEVRGTIAIGGGPPIDVRVKDVRDATVKMLNEAQPYSRSGHVDPGAIANYLFTMGGLKGEAQAGWAYYILLEAARAAGIQVTDEQIVNIGNEQMKKDDAGAKEMTLAQYCRRADEQARQRQREVTAIRIFRQLIESARNEPTYAQLFERFRQDYEELRFKYVFVDQKDAVIAMDAEKPEDKAKLQAWLDKAISFKAQHLVPDQADFQVLYVRFADVDNVAFDAMYAKTWLPAITAANLTVDDAVIAQRYKDNAFTWTKPLDLAREAAASRAAATRPATSTQPADLPEPYDLMKNRVRQEYLVAALLGRVFTEVTRAENPMTLEKAAETYGLTLATAKGLDQSHVLSHPDFGSASASSGLFSALGDGSLKPGKVFEYKTETTLFACKGPVEEFGRSVAIWKVLAYQPKREPTLADKDIIKDAVEQYTTQRRQETATEVADAFVKAVNERISADLKDKTAQLDAAMKAAVDAAIAKAGLSRDKTTDAQAIAAIENEQKGLRDQQLDVEKAGRELAAFEAVAAEQKLTVRDSNWAPRTVTRDVMPNAMEKLPTDEKASRFYRKTARMTALAGLKKGRIGAVESQKEWAAASVAVLTDRRDPAPEALGALGATQLTQLKSKVGGAQAAGAAVWTLENLKKPEWFGFNAPDLEKSIKAQQDTEQQRVVQEGRKKAAENAAKEARTAAITNDVRASRPLADGEGW